MRNELRNYYESELTFLRQIGAEFADKYPKIIGAITKDDVQKVAREYLHPDSFILVAVANQSEAALKLASYGAH